MTKNILHFGYFASKITVFIGAFLEIFVDLKIR